MPLVSIDNFSFTYAGAKQKALDGVNLEVEPGELLLLCGDSGGGKSTLLNNIKREIAPTGRKSGEIYFDGRPVSALSDFRSAYEIGLVKQNIDGQIVTDSVYGEMAFGLENLCFPPDVIRRRIAEISSFLGMGSWFSTPVTQLSGGQKQLLNIASVMVMQPRLLLLDEPTAQLDPVASGELLSLVERLCREMGLTVILTEQRLEEAFVIADRVAYMRKGEIAFIKTAKGVCDSISADQPFFKNLPSAARIFKSCAGTGDCPITVRDGRRWLKSVVGEREFPLTERNITEKENAASKKKAAIEINNAFFSYEKKRNPVIRGLNLSVYSGEITCIMGENGSGKTTLLKLMAGILKPGRGTVKIQRDLRLALLPQNPKAVFVCETVGEELVFGARQNGCSDPDSEAKAAAERFNVAHLLDRHPYDLSGGESQRAALARIYLCHPDIILLDEPTKGLDIESKENLGKFLFELAQEDKTVVIVSHDVEFAALYTHRCVLLFDGVAASKGKTRAFFFRNCFYTTAAGRIAAGFDANAITCEEVISLCR